MVTKTTNATKRTAREGLLLDENGNVTGGDIFSDELENEPEIDEAWRKSAQRFIPRVLWDPNAPERAKGSRTRWGRRRA